MSVSKTLNPSGVTICRELQFLIAFAANTQTQLLKNYLIIFFGYDLKSKDHLLSKACMFRIYRRARLQQIVYVCFFFVNRYWKRSN